jgi:hypothetical protein
MLTLKQAFEGKFGTMLHQAGERAAGVNERDDCRPLHSQHPGKVASHALSIMRVEADFEQCMPGREHYHTAGSE